MREPLVKRSSVADWRVRRIFNAETAEDVDIEVDDADVVEFQALARVDAPDLADRVGHLDPEVAVRLEVPLVRESVLSEDDIALGRVLPALPVPAVPSDDTGAISFLVPFRDQIMKLGRGVDHLEVEPVRGGQADRRRQSVLIAGGATGGPAGVRDSGRRSPG